MGGGLGDRSEGSQDGNRWRCAAHLASQPSPHLHAEPRNVSVVVCQRCVQWCMPVLFPSASPHASQTLLISKTSSQTVTNNTTFFIPKTMSASRRMGDTFRVRDISLKAEKKLLGKMSNKTIAKNFIDDTLCSVLDNLHALYKAYTGNRKEAEKLVKYIIKIVVKINILYRNDQFSAEDLKVGNQLRNKFNTIVKTVISFFEVDFSFDKAFLIKNINECRDLLKQLVGHHLTDKSIARIDFVLDIFTDAALLEEVFRKDSPHRPTLKTIVDDMGKAFDEGGI